jgi:hypothetical protein
MIYNNIVNKIRKGNFMKFTEFEIRQILRALRDRIVMLEKQNPVQNARRIKALKNTQDSLYKRLEEMKEGK